MSSSTTIPLIVLAGSDGSAVRLPDAGRRLSALTGYKGRSLELHGRPLVEVVADRFASQELFDPVLIAGPRRIYAEVAGGHPIIDTDGSFGENVATALEHVRRGWPNRRVGFTTCDVVPPETGVADLAARLQADGPRDLWFPLVRAPEQRDRLGAGAWKPTYRLRPGPDEAPVSVLPGHVAVVDPEALRREFVYRLVGSGYRTRNRPIARRRSAMLRELLGTLVWQDLTRLARLRLPTISWTVVREGLPAVARLRAGTLGLERLERAVCRIFMSRSHRRRHPERGVRIPLLDQLWLALDVDTEEEARQLGADRPA